MSITNNAASTTAIDDEIPFMKVFNRAGLKELLIAHQNVSDYMGTVAHTYNPMIYTLPREVAKPTKEEKSALARMLRREKEIMGKIRRLIDGADKDCDELLAKLGFSNAWEAGWNARWGTAEPVVVPQGNKDDGGDNNAGTN